MDIDIMSRQLADLGRRVTALEGGAVPEHMSPEGVVQEMEGDRVTEDRVKEIIAEHMRAERGAEPGGAATGDAGRMGVSSQVSTGTLMRDTPPSDQTGTPFEPFAQPGATIQTNPSGTVSPISPASTIGPRSPR